MSAPAPGGIRCRVVTDAPVDDTVDADGHEGRGGGMAVEALTGELAADVTAAAEAAVPGGTVERVEEDHGDGVFEAHVTDADGNSVEVTFDADFAVIDIAQGH